MKTFKVHITTRFDDDIEIKANSEAEATHIAWEMVNDGTYNATDSYDCDTDLYIVK